MTETKYIRGDGDMVTLVRNLDWSSTPLGPVESWPEGLLVTVNMLLAAPIPMQLFWGPEFICIYNDAMAPALSTKHPESLGAPARAVWNEAWPIIGPQLEQVLAEGKALSFENALVPLLRNGVMEDQYWTYSYGPVFSPDGDVLGVLDVAQNVTDAVLSRRDRDRTQEALERSEKRFRRLVDKASVGINIGTATGELTYLNHTLLDLLGYTEDEVREGEVRWDQLTPAKYAEADRQALQELERYGFAHPYEKLYTAKDGRLIPVQLGAVLIPALDESSDREDIAVFFTDLTRQKKAEAALLQAEKVHAVGRLASVISHEINNPLEAITNILYIVRSLPNLPQEATDYLHLADRELARVSHAAAQALSFHRISTSALTVSPDRLLDEVVSLYKGRLDNYKIAIQRRYAPGLELTCFEGDIRRVLNNIVINAMTAMLTGGKLQLRIRAATRWSTGQRGIRFTIADSGAGIVPEARDRIFEAFFTTRGIHGTGLGLWIACRIVHKHRGYVRARNCLGPGTGAIFELWLPFDLAASAHEPWHELA